MKITILGTGNAGTAVAADLSLKGHLVTLVKTSKLSSSENYNHLVRHYGRVRLIEDGKIRETKIAEVTNDLSVIRDSRLIIVYVQTTYHENLIRRIRPYLKDDQILLFNPGYLSTAYVLKHCPGVNPAIVEAQSSFIDARLTRPGVVRVCFRNVRNPLAVFPQERQEEVQLVLDELGLPFTYLDSVIEAALHNPNLIVHTVGAFMSIPRIEKTRGDYCMYHEVFTPSVWRLLEALDKEKIEVLAAFGFAKIPYVEACKFRNTLDEEQNAKDVFFWYASMPSRARGPFSADSRYLTEDVPQGLVLLESLGLMLGVSTPICSSLINLSSAALGRDLRRNGRTVGRLGSNELQRIIDESTLRPYAQTG